MKETLRTLPVSRPAPRVFDRHNDFWLGGSCQLADVTLVLPDACIDEMHRVLPALSRLADSEQPASTVLRGSVIAAVPRTVEFAAELCERLDHGVGTVIVDRFPAERWTDVDNRRVVALFAQLVSPLKPQGFDGTMLYDVIDRKLGDVSRVRRSITNLGQPYHTDGPWYESPARYIGLYCIRNAEHGGHGRVTSLLSAIDALRTLDEGRHLQTLKTRLPWDRQGEHGDGEATYLLHPLLVEGDTGVVARYYESYVRRGHELAGIDLPKAVDEALHALAGQLAAQSSVQFLLEPGQFQYANNYTVVHARDAFEDAPDAGRGRRLVRVWHA